MNSGFDRFISPAGESFAVELAFKGKEDCCGGCCAAMFPPGRETANSKHAINLRNRLDLITTSRRPRA
jgi:hypothetical protein